MSLKIGVVADTHVPSTYVKIPDELWRGLDGCDQLVHAGDFDSWETYQEFKQRFPTAAVLGNRDTFQVCEEVPEWRILEAAGVSVGSVYGYGRPKDRGAGLRKEGRAGPVDLLV